MSYIENHVEGIGALTACETPVLLSLLCTFFKGQVEAQHMDSTRMCVRTVVCINVAYSLAYVNISSHAGK